MVYLLMSGAGRGAAFLAMTAAAVVGLAWHAAYGQGANLEGSWSGGGQIVFPSGETEKARCRASFRRSEFFNQEFGLSGSIRITVNGNSLNASLTGGGGSASFSLSR
jgi:hypothetical protein